MNETSIDDLKPGKTYRVELGDCCIQGEFTSRLAAMTRDGDSVDTLTFDNGVVLTTAWQVTFTEQPQ